MSENECFKKPGCMSQMPFSRTGKVRYLNSIVFNLQRSTESFRIGSYGCEFLFVTINDDRLLKNFPAQGLIMVFHSLNTIGVVNRKELFPLKYFPTNNKSENFIKALLNNKIWVKV